VGRVDESGVLVGVSAVSYFLELHTYISLSELHMTFVDAIEIFELGDFGRIESGSFQLWTVSMCLFRWSSPENPNFSRARSHPSKWQAYFLVGPAQLSPFVSHASH
jgi:hypothetical protein